MPKKFVSMVDRPDPGPWSRFGEWCGKRKGWLGVGATVAVVLAGVIGLTLFYDPPTQPTTDPGLRVQEEVLRWTYGLFLTGIAALLVSSLGLAALYYTFLAQRTLAQDQTRGYVEILVGRVAEHPELGFRYSLDIQAHGATPVFKVNFQGSVVVSGVEWHGSKAPRAHSLSAYVEQLLPNASWTLTSRARDEGAESGHYVGLSAFKYREEDGSAARRYGVHITEDGADDAVLMISGRLGYEDVYRRSHSIDVHQFLHINFDGRLRGTGTKAPQFGLD